MNGGITDTLREVVTGPERKHVGLYGIDRAVKEAARLSRDPLVCTAAVVRGDEVCRVFVMGAEVKPEHRWAEPAAEFPMMRVESTNVARIGAVSFSFGGAARCVVEVQFLNGGIYRYADAGPAWEALRMAALNGGSIGKAFAAHLKHHPRELTARRTIGGAFERL